MASLIYSRALELLAQGSINFASDTFKVLLTTAAYTEDKDSHDFRNDVTNEVTGTGYTAGGRVATVSVALDTANDRVDIALGGTTWAASSITARKAVYYKSRGGAASADELIAVIDFTGDVSSSSGDFTLTASTLRFQN